MSALKLMPEVVRVLTIYATEKHYSQTTNPDTRGTLAPLILRDRGAEARELLKKIKEETSL